MITKKPTRLTLKNTSISAKKAYFTKGGKPLSRKGIIEQEFISSLAEINLLTPTTNQTAAFSYKKTQDTANLKKSAVQTYFSRIQDRVSEKVTNTATLIIGKAHHFSITPRAMMPAIAFVVILSTFAVISTFSKSNATYSPRYSIFSSKPLVLGDMSSRVYGEDSRAETLNKVFEKYKCPFEDLGNVFVEEADKNNIPFWIVAAISFQESNCGRKTPKTDEGKESYNAWGWAVWGNNVHGFDSWEAGIGVLSRYINNKFYSKGTTDLCEIMKVYTPPSDGSWCNGVSYFKAVIEDYKSPTTK